jgi:AhpD family alkylhydroperoxidase
VFISLSGQLNHQIRIDSNLADLVGLVVSQDNSCRFCFGVMRALLRTLGLPESRIRELELDLHTAEFDAKERAALDFARKLSRSNPLTTPEDLKALRALGFEKIEVMELAAVTAMHLFFNRACTFTALPPQLMEEAPDRWYMRLFGPLMKLRIRKSRTRGKPVWLEPGQADGPYAAIVSALDGLPIAAELRRLIDVIWMPEGLKPRTVGLIFAVVARALGCSNSEEEAVRLVLREGMSREAIEETLTHLASSELDDAERIVVPFARDTVWYRPAQIQRKGREALRELSREQFLEFVVVASLANSICRLAVVTGDCA